MSKNEISTSLFWKSQLWYLKMNYRTCVPKYMRISVNTASTSKYKPDINKRKESSAYPHFSIWTIELNNQTIGEGKCLFIRIFQQTQEERMTELQFYHFTNPNEWKDLGIKGLQFYKMGHFIKLVIKYLLWSLMTNTTLAIKQFSKRQEGRKEGNTSLSWIKPLDSTANLEEKQKVKVKSLSRVRLWPHGR